MKETHKRAKDILTDLKGLDKARELFAELNYDVTHDTLSRAGWGKAAAEALSEDPQIIAAHGDFQIIYGRLASDRLLIGRERPVVNRLLQNHQYALFLFSDIERENWHFVNVKYDDDVSKRRLFRRITVGPDERLRTAIERLSMLDLEAIRPGLAEIPPLEIQTRHDEAFDVEAVTKEFYKTYKVFFQWIVKTIGQNKDKRKTHAFTQQLLNRLMFIYFIQKLCQGEENRKYWLNNDPFYLKNLWNRYQKNNWGKDKFYSLFLEGLFFYAFNKNYGLHNLGLPKEVANEYANMPYLNGGLFSKESELDNIGFFIPDIIFEKLFNPDQCLKDKEGKLHYGLLEHYNFTVREDTPLDVEVAVDPVMLGKVYESLVNEEERGRAGIFYTQPAELNFMCRSALTEYLDGKIPLSKAEIIHLVNEIDNPESIPESPAISLTVLRESLENLRIVDPACGSGAFLVTMLNILVQLHSYIAFQSGSEPNTFQLKKEIISNNLFGVDIKEWACRVAELRLWLSLIIETEGKFIDLYTRPLLPNLSFKIRCGDSLVEEIAGKSISLRGEFSHIGSGLRRKIDELLDVKKNYFDNRLDKTAGELRIKKMQDELFKKIISDKITEIDASISTLKFTKPEQQRELFAKTEEQQELFEKDEKERKIKDEMEIRRLSQEKDTLVSIYTQGKGKFFWDIDFAEVFTKGGFDIVIGNPPYVRQEKIAPQDLLPEEITPEIKRKYKEQLFRSVQTQWGSWLKIEKRADLYIYFYLHGLSLLNPNGIFCFITSNSWLDVGYGAGLQEFLLRNIKTKLICDNLAKRSFAESDVNTIITLFQRPDKKEKLDSGLVKFVAFKKPFGEVINSDNLISIENSGENVNTSDFRLRALTQSKLLVEGMEAEEEKMSVKGTKHLVPGEGAKEIEEPSAPYLSLGKEHVGKYVGNKWGGKYLRAPDIFFKILEKGKGKLVRLGDIAEVRFGIKTGCNEFFYLPSKHFDIKKEGKYFKLIPKHEGLPENLRIEEEFLIPIVKTAKDSPLLSIDSSKLNTKLFCCHEFPAGKDAQRYIDWGEKRKFHKIRSVSGRKFWFDVGVKNLPSGIIPRRVGERMPVFVANGCLEDCCLFGILLNDKNMEQQYLALLNTTPVRLDLEVNTRHLTGAQAVADTNVYVVKELNIVDIDTLNVVGKQKLSEAWFKVSKRKSMSIFRELGIDPKQPIRSQKPNPLPDRKALDDIVFDILGLTRDERNEVYCAVCELVKNRLDKARSV